jgi:hypothetical protein
MSGGATPSSSMRRTDSGCWRSTSSARRVPYEAAIRLMRSAPSARRTASTSFAASVVVKRRRSPYGNFIKVWRQRARACKAACVSSDSRNGCVVAESSSQRSGALRPVPRWSISTMSRRFDQRASSRDKGPARSIALCPGPPAKKNTGSAFGLRDSAGSTAK